MITVKTKLFSIDEYHRLIDLGVFTASDRIELIKGQLVEMSPKGTAHSVSCSVLYRELSILLSGIAALRCQDPITLTDSEPEPDLIIARGREADYLDRHPHPTDIVVAIEISDSTLGYDRANKLSLYAEHNISNYWIVNLVVRGASALRNRQLESYSQPYEKPNGEYGYLNQQIYVADRSIQLPGFEGILLELDRIFPR
jgi:Uma2 family endonuclease